ncbi:unnamed protein product [Heligmosomoides polygyrus]|uniref:7TM_GPCR_Srx domain-containing protein n=1 Tax=Heligmosomoides polygyrus TaxID=6339 RepID=A0A183FTX8_HELPZ|nr:unnamed protein product [Heligmosomoides polygyrus]
MRCVRVSTTTLNSNSCNWKFSQISLFGSLGNWLVATTALRIPAIKNSFGQLLTSQSTAEALLCSAFAFVYSPMVFSPRKEMESDIRFLKSASGMIGMSLTVCYDVCIFSHLLIASNRLVAICLPMHYDNCAIEYGEDMWTFVFKETKVKCLV